MEGSNGLSEGGLFANKRFPEEESYGLVSQMRRAVVSIPSNIAEGAARDSHKEFIRFLYISLGSLAELETQLLKILKRSGKCCLV